MKLIPALGLLICLCLSTRLAAMGADVSDWISTYVLSENVDPEDYWDSLKKLGEAIDADTATGLAALEAHTREDAVALMAHEVAQNPERVDTLVAWYGRPMYQVTRETYEKAGWVFNDERWAAHQRRRNMRRDKFNPERLRAEHQIDRYRTAWQAWLLSPRLRGTVHERHRMAGHIYRALLSLPHSSNIQIAILTTKQLQLINDPAIREKDLRRLQLGEALSYASIVLEYASKESVIGILELNRIAVNKGYADASVEEPGHGPNSHFTLYMERALAARNFYTIDEIFKDPEKWGAQPARGRSAYVIGDHWKTFKPIIEELLADPQAYNLLEIDIELLQNALRLMPDAPFPSKDR